jgi:hypothetical protein
MVGFNRRFAPHVTRVRELLRSVKEPKAFDPQRPLGPGPCVRRRAHSW